MKSFQEFKMFSVKCPRFTTVHQTGDPDNVIYHNVCLERLTMIDEHLFAQPTKS